MIILKKINPEWSLRLGLGLMYLYSGYDLFMHPTAWVWAIPFWLRVVIGSVAALNSYLRFQGIIEIIFAAVFLAWFLPKGLARWTALLATLEFAAILILAFMPWSETNFLITFRDIGLLGAASALFILLSKENGSRFSTS